MRKDKRVYYVPVLSVGPSINSQRSLTDHVRYRFRPWLDRSGSGATCLWLCTRLFFFWISLTFRFIRLLSGILPTATDAPHDRILSQTQADETRDSPPPPPFRQPGVLIMLERLGGGRRSGGRRGQRRVHSLNYLLSFTCPSSSSSHIFPFMSGRLPSIASFDDTELLANFMLANRTPSHGYTPPPFLILILLPASLPLARVSQHNQLTGMHPQRCTLDHASNPQTCPFAPVQLDLFLCHPVSGTEISIRRHIAVVTLLPAPTRTPTRTRSPRC
jgi:hypothetical protein